ncbi:MAG: hypothetical protein JWQ01_1160 [Massilia sp.]|nr:hypothetical protein [Massilia sp.]
MLDFTSELLTRNQNAADPATQRSPVERSLAERRTTATIRSPAPLSPKRRRNDALSMGKQARLQW